MGQGKTSSYGVLIHDNQHLCFIIEDEHRDVKLDNETRIPKGKYSIKFREVDSPMTLKYRKKYPDFFTYHLELQNIENFEYVYIHVGNAESNTSGCLLTNTGVTSKRGDWVGTESVKAFKEVYKLVAESLANGEEVSIEVLDEDYWLMPF